MIFYFFYFMRRNFSNYEYEKGKNDFFGANGRIFIISQAVSHFKLFLK